jgi:hypothetical protein
LGSYYDESLTHWEQLFLFFWRRFPLSLDYYVVTSFDQNPKPSTHIGSIAVHRIQPLIPSEISSEIRMGTFVKELWAAFLRIQNRLWLTPLLPIMVAIGGLLILTQGSVIAPFIYTLL